MSDMKIRMETEQGLQRKLRRSRQESGGTPAAGIVRLQGMVGNRAMQRLLVQRKAGQGFDLDDETAQMIESERSSGQPLPKAAQEELGDQLGADFSGVRVHTSAEASELNDRVNAQAFTSGQDIFFREGLYDPNSEAGKQVLAHELTHVVQQSTGQVSNPTGVMHVNPAGDVFEHQAEQAASKSKPPATGSDVQRQELEDEEDETLQRVVLEEEEEIMPIPEDDQSTTGWSVRTPEQQNWVEDIKSPNLFESKYWQDLFEDFIPKDQNHSQTNFPDKQYIPDYAGPEYWEAPYRNPDKEGYIPQYENPDMLVNPETGETKRKEESTW